MWEIREGYGRKDEVEEAYEQGWRDAMEEVSRSGWSYGHRGGRMGMREDYDDMGERRRRDSRGRYM